MSLTPAERVFVRVSGSGRGCVCGAAWGLRGAGVGGKKEGGLCMGVGGRGGGGRACGRWWCGKGKRVVYTSVWGEAEGGGCLWEVCWWMRILTYVVIKV